MHWQSRFQITRLVKKCPVVTSRLWWNRHCQVEGCVWNSGELIKRCQGEISIYFENGGFDVTDFQVSGPPPGWRRVAGNFCTLYQVRTCLGLQILMFRHYNYCIEQNSDYQLSNINTEIYENKQACSMNVTFRQPCIVINFYNKTS